MPSVPWRVESSKIFKIIKKFSKFLKCPKSFPKLSKRVLNLFSGDFSKKFFAQCCFGVFFSKRKLLPSVPWRVESSKFFKKIKNFSKFLKCPKSFPKVSKRVLNIFSGDFFEKLFCPVFHGGSSLRKFSKKSKTSKIQKSPKSFPKVSKRVLNMFSGVFFRKQNFAQCSMEGRVFENFQNNQKIFKSPKMPKIVPKIVQTCFELVFS